MSKLSVNSLFDIQVFVLLYESLNATAVSQTLGVPSSKISRSLKSLRHSLNAPLFIRKQQGFEASDLANDIYPKMKRIVELAKHCEKIEVGTDNLRTRKLVIACPPTLSLNLLNHLQARACEDQESFLFHIKPCTSNVAELIKQQHVDIAVTYSAYNTEQLTSSLIATSSNYVLVAKQGHPLLSRQQSLELDDIFDYPYISFSGNELNDVIDPLECYALDVERKLKLVVKVCFLADLMLQLEQSDAIALLSHLDAVEFLCQRGNIGALKLERSLCESINQRSGRYHYYLTQMRKNTASPSWVGKEIHRYIQANITSDSEGYNEEIK
ncbi:LysR family transcriptional regulator [Shewanella pealeana]|uniref:Transcriptional regulator, LysR family n=1 Tax=Shewanella pealeana (strain ATCC 700345 / ANG-SQ1) TaxID=398579 RepID=A8H8J8_SHEPA|nr:LysR family transcriptional regulator [Shewanella pealeana]ABV88885.1 transcriptional regulator, LysR family [Shewanella pealeana ATCC 700345]